jgi:hypothetical protein
MKGGWFKMMCEMKAEGILNSIKSMIDINTFMQEWDEVAFWKQQLKESIEYLKANGGKL